MPTARSATWSVILLGLIATVATSSATEPSRPGFIARALSCQLTPEELPSLMQRFQSGPDSVGDLTRSYTLPSGNLYRLNQPVAALGYVSDAVYVQPGRIALVLRDPLSKVAQRLHLRVVPFGPAARKVDEDRSIVAWQLHQSGLAGQTLIGCEYSLAAASAWPDDVANSTLPGL